jgi:hypothetical protein
VPPIAAAVQPDWDASPDAQSAAKDEQLPWLVKIAKGIEALVAKEGIVIEEVRA